MNHSCPCKNYYYDVINQKNCSACYFKCASCQQEWNVCSQCSMEDGRSLLADICVCSVGFDDNINSKCQKCHYSCGTCAATKK